MVKKKVFIFLPDGGGLRNFVYASFSKLQYHKEFEVVYWNNSTFPINQTFGFNELKIENSHVHPLTPLYSRARKRIELHISKKKNNDAVYETYKFPLSFKGFKRLLTSIFIKLLIFFYKSEKGLDKLKCKIENLERKNPNYKIYKAQLESHEPDLVFCSNQRNTKAISPLLAARDLGIKTACFIQSWDNVPKAMQVLNTDFYMVWSHLMKQQLLTYYPYIKQDQVFVTGTPQFEMHYDKRLHESRISFFKRYHLDIHKKYICFSGDDTTTSPLDHYYLEDLVNAVRKINKRGQNIGIIFRRCPPDTSNRYDKVLNTNKDIIAVLEPLWSKVNNTGAVLPTPEDAKMLYNVCEHSELVTNVCSSTVFDFVAHHKPCLYYNYEQPQLKKGVRDIGQNYNYVHFRSMPSKDAVIFCEDKTELETLVFDVIYNKKSNVSECLKWYEIVIGKNPSEASLRIWNALKQILNNEC